MDNFEYKSLDSSTSEIRLLILLPGEPNDDIQCALIHSLLSDPHRFSYIALSYTWGDASFRRPIRVNGERFSITQNLDDALRHMRSPEDPRVLWIDAICINQTDLNERGHQVQKMREIYQSASSVLVWLGKADDDTENALNFMGFLADENPTLEVLENEDTTDIFSALIKFFNRDYWKRFWIIQECTVARNIVLACGPWSFPWSLLTRFAQWLERNSTSPKVLDVDEFAHFCTLINIKEEFENRQGVEPYLVITLTSRFQATDPRDRIYALLGISQDIYSASLIPDYSKSVERVYAELVEHLITADGNLNTLHRVCTGSDDSNFPSWVPDFSKPAKDSAYVGFGFKRLARGYGERRFSAAGTSRPDVEFSTMAWNVVAMRGILFDSIEKCDGPIYTSDWSPDDIQRLETLAMQTLTSSLSSMSAKQNLDPRESFWRTIIMNSNLERTSPARSSYGDIVGFLLGRAGIPATFEPYTPLRQRMLNYTWPFTRCAAMAINTGYFFTTSSGCIGVCTGKIRQGDLIVVLFGADMPFVLRKHGEHYLVIGPAYVHGIMKGELVSVDQNGNISTTFPIQEFVLH